MATDENRRALRIVRRSTNMEDAERAGAFTEALATVLNSVLRESLRGIGSLTALADLFLEQHRSAQ